MAKAILLTAADCLAHIGNPINEKCMTLWDVPPELEIGVIPKRVYCHQAMVEPLAKAFTALIQSGEVQFLKTWDGCFNIRAAKGGSSPSLHSWGLAVDVNAAWNQFGKPPNLRPQFVQCFTDAGFDWGGEWSTPDGMHFQLSRAKFAWQDSNSGLSPLERDIKAVIDVHFVNHDAHPQAVALTLAEMIPSLLGTLAWQPQNIQAAVKSAQATIQHLQAKGG